MQLRGHVHLREIERSSSNARITAGFVAKLGSRWEAAEIRYAD